MAAYRLRWLQNHDPLEKELGLQQSRTLVFLDVPHWLRSHLYPAPPLDNKAAGPWRTAARPALNPVRPTILNTTTPDRAENKLYYGGNLDVLRR